MSADDGSIDAEGIVQRQLDAYNARDIDGFMAMWAADAQYFEHPAKLLASGAAEILAGHIAGYKKANLFGLLIKRTVDGNKVVDQEVVTRTFAEGTGRVDVVAIYEVKDDKIANAWFILGSPVLDAQL